MTQVYGTDAFADRQTDLIRLLGPEWLVIPRKEAQQFELVHMIPLRTDQVDYWQYERSVLVSCDEAADHALVQVKIAQSE